MSRSSPLIFRGTDDWHCFVPAVLIHLPANGLDSLRRDETTRSLTCACRVCRVLDMCGAHGHVCMLRFTGCQPPQGWVSLVERRGYWLKASLCRDPGPADQVPSGSVGSQGTWLEEQRRKSWLFFFFFREGEMGGRLVSVWLPPLEVWPDRVLKPGSRGLCRINDLFFFFPGTRFYT